MSCAKPLIFSKININFKSKIFCLLLSFLFVILAGFLCVLYSETLELFLFIEPNRIKHGFGESELFQYFDIFMSSVRSNRNLFYCIWMLYMMYLMHFNDFYEFDSIEPNSKKHRNIEKIRFGSIELNRLNSVRFGSIFQESSRVSLYPFRFL